jgi:hypothetical protein
MLGLFWRAIADLRRGGRDAERILTAIALVGTLIATAVVGAFDAVLLIAVPTFFVWTLAGALAPPSDEGVIIERRLYAIGLITVLVMGTIAIGRSGFQLAAMAVFSSTSRTTLLERASSFDPGNYRIHTRLAQAYLSRGDCRHALPHARAAHALYPNAGEPRRQVAACGGR